MSTARGGIGMRVLILFLFEVSNKSEVTRTPTNDFADHDTNQLYYALKFFATTSAIRYLSK